MMDLQKRGIPASLVDLWRKAQGESLLPVQITAVKKGLLGIGTEGRGLHAPNMLVLAPTTSGKSFCAEMAAVRALMNRQRAILVSPLKAVAEQQFKVLKQRYERLGVTVLIVTADHPDSDRRFTEGRYDIAVAIYEKLDLLLTANLDSLKNVGLVVIDEIQSLGEPGRGPVVERLITKIIASVYYPQLLGLSAVISDDDASAVRLAAWMNAVVVQERSRPVDLLRGVAAGGSFRYRSFNNGLDGQEQFCDLAAGEDSFEGFVQQLKGDTGGTLVFLKSRRQTVECALKLAAAVAWPGASHAVELLLGEEPSYLVRCLRQVLGRGVAFHNSDLSPHQRAVVEEAFAEGEARVLFATTTLSMGVNLAADTVYLETVKYCSGEYGERPELVPVSRADFDNMTGRAGRLGSKDQGRPARAIVLAESEFDREVLWETYIASETPSPVSSSLASMPLADWLLNMAATGLVREVAAIPAIYAKTLFFLERQECPDCEMVISELTAAGLVEELQAGVTVRATGLGRAAARSGISVRQSAHFLARLAEGWPQTEVGWLAMTLSAPGWSLPPGMLTRYERSENLVVRMLYRRYSHFLTEARFLLPENHQERVLSYREMAKLKALLLLEEWRSMTAAQELEQAFQMHMGQILSLGEMAAHLVSALAALLEASSYECPQVALLRDISFGLRTGVSPRLAELFRHFRSVLNRSEFAALGDMDVTSMADLSRLPRERLQRAVSQNSKLDRIERILETFREDSAMHMLSTATSAVKSPLVSLSTQPESIEVDGSFDGERYLVKVNGFPIRLTGKSFKYFAKLAWFRLRSDTGWTYKDDLETGFNQARYLYRMKQEICGALDFDWQIVENNRLGYYRLIVEPFSITINVDNLKNHYDFELRDLATRDYGTEAD